MSKKSNNTIDDKTKALKAILIVTGALFLIGTFIPNGKRCDVDSNGPMFGPTILAQHKCEVANDYAMFGLNSYLLSGLIVLTIAALLLRKPKFELALHGPTCIIGTLQLCRLIFAYALGEKLDLSDYFFIHILMLGTFIIFNANAFFANPIVFDRIKKSENHSWQKVLLLFMLPPLSLLGAQTISSTYGSTPLAIATIIAFAILFVLEFASIFVLRHSFTKAIAPLGIFLLIIQTIIALHAAAAESSMNKIFYGIVIQPTILALGLTIYDYFSLKSSKRLKSKPRNKIS